MTAQSELDRRPAYSLLSLFTGAGGLDLGFESEGFRHIEALELEPWCVRTLRANRPHWRVLQEDVRVYCPRFEGPPDALIAGFPCQGFSLGGIRDAGDERNLLYREVVRVAGQTKPRIVVIENVLNLRSMRDPGTNQPFAKQIAAELRGIGYDVAYGVLKMSQFGVPQTRRRFVFVAFRGQQPQGYHLPVPEKETAARDFLYDLAQDTSIRLPNHQPRWGLRSAVHIETGDHFDPSEEVVPVRLSRTASDGHPIRSFDAPFPAIDTATVWGWAQGHVTAARFSKDRAVSRFIRNPDATVTLWRVSASRLRTFTDREYARLQTFPDDWVFLGRNKRDIHLQIGNAVPMRFAEKLAANVRQALIALDTGTRFRSSDTRPVLRLF